jgi:NAD(P)-dependent dehydrogenase (short-subunit alcohol dehydrogenase family)
MELVPGKVAVVTGAASGIGLALAMRFAASGLHVVLADVDESALGPAVEQVRRPGVDTLAVPTDVSDEAAVLALATAARERFGAVHVVCNNAGVSSRSDPWFGPLEPWKWVLGVNLWGVIHGVRAFLPGLIEQGEGHIVNTASIAGLVPGFGPSYDAGKHAVVALTEDLYTTVRSAGLPIGVSVLCPGWVRTSIMDAERNWAARLGTLPPPPVTSEIIGRHARTAIDEGMPPAAVADLVADAVQAGSFWIFPHPEFVDLAVRRWHGIAEGSDPEVDVDMPGMPPRAEMLAELRAAMEPPGG